MKSYLKHILWIVPVMLMFSACSPGVYVAPENNPYDTYDTSEPYDRPYDSMGTADTPDALPESSHQQPFLVGTIPDDTQQKPSAVPVIIQLMDKAREQMDARQFDQAFGTAERAYRLEPSNPEPWHLLAEIQLRRGNIAQAEHLARKSNLLSKGNKALQAKNWRIIAEATRQRGKMEESEQASRRARELESQTK